MTRKEFNNKYCNYIVEMLEAMKNNKYKLNNKIALKLTNLLDNNKNYIDEEFISLINHENKEIGVIACADSLRENNLVKESLKKLKEIEKNDNGLLGFRAKMSREIFEGKWEGKKL